ncbi:DUF7507 domain-containing protein [Nesterenkonia muleiensis]|uniref:DUF7507 domain-containing protein n=1 Tax=Nesterenkonia muleiensis TaxID=2282648 RepID=UPI000E7524C3|nr:VWA domain-containing protein [Nesterenkonia muleiensis]
MRQHNSLVHSPLRHRADHRRSPARLFAAVLTVGLVSLSGPAASAAADVSGSPEPVESESSPVASPTGEPTTSTEETAEPTEDPAEEPGPTETAAEESGSPSPTETEAEESDSPIPTETGDTARDPSESETPVEPEESEDSAQERTEDSEEDEDLATPMEVPEPEDTEAIINVNVGGDRSGDTSVGNLAGVTLRLHDGGSGGPGDPVEEEWATCESDADGDCSFVIPETQSGSVFPPTSSGENRDRRFWVVAESAPDGWQLNQGLVTGGANNQSVTSYAFRTGYSTILGSNRGVRAGNTYQSGEDFMSGSGSTASGGVWQSSRANPELPETCEAGLNVALVLDLSGSVSNVGALGDLKEASKEMTEALAGTGSSLALYTFATTAPRNNGSTGRNYDLMPIDEGNNLQTIKDRIDAYQAGGGTNWDRGIYQAAQSSANYDLAVVVTDGLPTFYGPGQNPSGPGNSTRLIEAEQAIFSANALKSQGTRTLAVGVGAGVSGNPANLSAISGPNGYAGQQAHEADYFQEDWARLADLLEEIALGATCQASIEITKETLVFGDETPSNGGAGWEFGASTTGGTLSPESSQTTDDQGQVEYDLHFDTPTPEPAQLSIEEILSSEQAAEGWSLEDITCTVNGQDVPVGDSRAELTVTVGDDVDCTFLNVQQLVPGISVEKQAWDTPDAGGLDGAEEIEAGAQVTDGATITWTYTVTNTGETVLHDIQVTDDQLDPDGVECPRTSLDPDESMTCTASGAVTALDP